MNPFSVHCLWCHCWEWVSVGLCCVPHSELWAWVLATLHIFPCTDTEERELLVPLRPRLAWGPAKKTTGFQTFLWAAQLTACLHRCLSELCVLFKGIWGSVWAQGFADSPALSNSVSNMLFRLSSSRELWWANRSVCKWGKSTQPFEVLMWLESHRGPVSCIRQGRLCLSA